MSDTSKSAQSVESSSIPGGSSDEDLPNTEKRGHSVTNEQGDDSTPALPISDQPTAISKQPAIGQNVRPTSLGRLVKSLVGQRLQHFEVNEFVGGGGMGAVFRGKDLSLGRTVAVKVLSRDSLDEETVKRFHHEARSAAKLDHPRIPHVYFVGEHEGWHFIVFEFIEGDNIRDVVLKKGPLAIDEAVAYLADIAEAIQHASDRDVVHRDVKPSNVLVTNDGRARLVDMGLARTDQLQSATGDLTATGVTLGTFDYISPEQAKDPRNADTRSDIYSLGCTLYYMLTGRPPFPEGTMLQKLLSHTAEAPTDPSEFRDDVPPALNELLARMLAKKPEDRHQDATDLLGDILMLAEDEKIQLNNDRSTGLLIERTIIQETGLFRHIPWLIPLVVLVSTALALHFWQGEPSPPPQMPTQKEPAEAEDTEDVDDVEIDVSTDALFEPFDGVPPDDGSTSD